MIAAIIAMCNASLRVHVLQVCINTVLEVTKYSLSQSHSGPVRNCFTSLSCSIMIKTLIWRADHWSGQHFTDSTKWWVSASYHRRATWRKVPNLWKQEMALTQRVCLPHRMISAAHHLDSSPMSLTQLTDISSQLSLYSWWRHMSWCPATGSSTFLKKKDGWTCRNSPCYSNSLVHHPWRSFNISDIAVTS